MTAKLFTLPKQVPFTNAGALIPGSKAYFFEAGTSTPLSTYTDYTLGTPHAHPVVADGNGRFPAIYYGTGDYKVVINDASDVEIYSQDYISNALTQTEVAEALYPQTATELAAGVTPTNYQYLQGDIRRYGAVGDDSTDNATAIQNAIDVAEVSGGEVYIPEGDFRFETGLTNTANITMRGATVELSLLKKVGNIDGITVTNNPSSIFTRFALDATGDTTGVGLKIKSGGRGRHTELLIQNQGSHGIHVGTATAGESNNLASFRDIKSLTNGGDGIKVEGEATPDANQISMFNLDLRGNTGWGLNLEAAWTTYGMGIAAQNNTGGGIRFNNARRCYMFIYAESNTGDQVELANHANCSGNILFLNASASTGLVDNTGNQDTFADGDVVTGTDRITVTGHPFSDSDRAILTTTGTLPAGLELLTRYYIKSIDANTIELYSDRALTSIVDITAAAGGGTHTIRSADLDANMLISGKHQAEFEPKIRNVSTDQLSMTSQQFDGTDAIGRLDITHPSDRRFDFTASGTGADQDLYFLNSAAGNLNISLDGRFGANGVTPPAQASHIIDPTGGATTDAEARTAINAILVVLENLGFTATS